MSQPRTDTAYFKEQLNYTMGEEDTRVEWSLLPEGARHVLAISGSGSRVVPLLARAPGRLTCVDVSSPQLYLTELRLAALGQLEHPEYLAFFGYPPTVMEPRERERHFQRLTLSAPAREFLEGFFKAHAWGPPLYAGRFERMLKQLAQVNRLITGKAGQGLFEARTLAQQAEYLQTRFPHRAWNVVMMVLGNSTVLNSLLYRGDFPKKNIPGSTYSIYQRIFRQLFETCLARESFFLQLVFFGELRFAEGNLVECEPDVFARAKAALGRTQLRLQRGDLFELARQEGNADFVSLSDVPSFLKGEREQGFLQELRPSLVPGALVVTRGHLRVQNPDATGFEPVTSSHEDLLRHERTQLWQMHVYKKAS